MFRFFPRHAVAAMFLVLVAALASSSAFAQKTSAKKPAGPEEPAMLSLEVAALNTLNHLELSQEQLQELLRLSKGTASAPRAQGQTKVTPAFVKTLTALRNALLADDEDRIDDLKTKLAEIMDKDKIQIEDRVSVSEAARRQSIQVIRMLKPIQVRDYLETLDEDELDPLEIIQDALDQGKGVDASRWKSIREPAAAEAAWLLAGSDESKSGPLAKRIASLMDQHRAASAKPSKGSTADLDKQLIQLTANRDPFSLLRHAMEREMAELLSNPCLPQALRHTLEQKRKPISK